MGAESEKLIFKIHSAFLMEYSQAASCLSEFYKTVSIEITFIRIQLFLEFFCSCLEACVQLHMN